MHRWTLVVVVTVLVGYGLHASHDHRATGAVVALARKLAGFLYAMMRDGTDFDPQRCGAKQGC